MTTFAVRQVNLRLEQFTSQITEANRQPIRTGVKYYDRPSGQKAHQTKLSINAD